MLTKNIDGFMVDAFTSAHFLRFSIMKWLPIVALWCLTTAVSILSAEPLSESTTVANVSVIAGPWMLLGEDQVVRCGIEISGIIEASAVSVHRAGQVVAAKISVRPFQVANRPASAVVEVALPESFVGEWIITLPGRSLTMHLAAAPTRNDVSRVVIVGPNNWPRSEDLARVAERAGGAVQLVVAHGLESVVKLGTGGWESSVPVVILPQPLSAWIRELEGINAIARARLGDLEKHWSSGLCWGGLGLPWASDPAVAASTIARDLSPWEVCLAPTSWWELGLLAPRIDRRISATTSLIGLCQHLQVPLILTLGSGAGWISEPLLVEADHLVIGTGGTRVVAATPSGDGVGLLPSTIAATIDESGIIALIAHPDHLRLLGIGFSGNELMDLKFMRDRKGGFVGNGAGHFEELGQDVVNIRSQWLTADEAGVTARARCQWMTSRQLATFHIESTDFLALIKAHAAGVAVVPLLRRLSSVEAVAGNVMSEHQAELPDLVLRDLLLRQLAQPKSFDPQRWMSVIATTADIQMLAIILRAEQDDIAPFMLDILVARVRAQAAGTTPLEVDALRQHRLMTAVFDSTSLSPTDLRPLAVALRPRLTPFTVGPVERFIARHGELRK